MEKLLLKTRLLSKSMQKGAVKPVDFEGIVKVLSGITESQVMLIGRRGKLLSYSMIPGIPDLIYKPKMSSTDKVIDEEENRKLLGVRETETQLNGDTEEILTIVPVYGGGERLGTLIFGKMEDCFSTSDMVLFEYAATVTGLEILRLINERKDQKAREREAVKLAMDVMSYSETEALRLIFNDVNGREAFLVASNIAKKHRLTRSIIVNALKKLESAGLINARSLGMKGTHIKILNDYFLDQIQAV